MLRNKVGQKLVPYLVSLIMSLSLGCMLGTNVNAKPVKVKKVNKAVITAYTPHENKGSRITASGKKVREGYVAVSKDLYKSGWKFGKKVQIKKKTYIIQDILPSRKSGIDIFMENYDKAIQFGVQRHDVVLLD